MSALQGLAWNGMAAGAMVFFKGMASGMAAGWRAPRIPIARWTGGEEDGEGSEEEVEALAAFGRGVDWGGHGVVLKAASNSSPSPGDAQEPSFEVVDVGECKGWLVLGWSDRESDVPMRA